jgi:uncharacterized membrane protein YoaK (UPF0700 family)
MGLDGVLAAMDETPAADNSESGPPPGKPEVTGHPPSEAAAGGGTPTDSSSKAEGGAKPDGPAKPGDGADLAPGVLTAIAVLLTIGTAATDVVSFTRLGSVFASVMTSNIVFLGLAAAQKSATLATHAAVSFAGYVIGVAAVSRLVRAGRGGAAIEKPWSRRIAAALVAETGVFVIFTIGWEVTGTKPAGGAQLFLLAIATIAMGMQSAVVVAMGISGVSTTYMTGTLTTLIEAIASPDPRKGADARRAIVLLALVAGAGLSGLMLAVVPAAVPAIPFAVLIGVIGIGAGPLRPRRHRGPV